ncbi:MAG: hypothetical protein KDA61_19700 [Planctomycetales bacterium]|nr:hypothetical protein [Planctomycetales bacterium]
MKRTLLAFSLAMATLTGASASAATICAPINCVKTIRDGIADDGVTHETPDGLGDDVGFHNSPLPPTGFALGENRVSSYVFELPALNGATLLNATLDGYLTENDAEGFNLDVVILKTDTDFHPAPADYEASIALLNGSQVAADDWATPATAAGTSLATVSGGNLLTYLQNHYIDGGYIHLMLVPDSLATNAAGQLRGHYTVPSPFALTNQLSLCLEVGSVPEPTSLLTALSGVAMLTGRRRRR